MDTRTSTRVLRPRRLLVDPRFQWRVAGCLAGVVFTVCAFLAVALMAFQEPLLRERLTQPNRDHTVATTAATIGFAVAFALVAAALFGAWCMLAMHRFCGPIQVVGGYLRALRKGRIPHTRPLRRSDEFQSFYAEVEQTLAVLRQRREEEVAALNDAVALLTSQQSGTPEAAAAADVAAARLTALRNQMRTALQDAPTAQTLPAGAEAAELLATSA